MLFFVALAVAVCSASKSYPVPVFVWSETARLVFFFLVFLVGFGDSSLFWGAIIF